MSSQFMRRRELIFHNSCTRGQIHLRTAFIFIFKIRARKCGTKSSFFFFPLNDPNSKVKNNKKTLAFPVTTPTLFHWVNEHMAAEEPL